MKRSLFSLFSLICFVSCIQEMRQDNIPVNDDIDLETVTIKASISQQPDTRTYISDDTGDEGPKVKIYWSNNDYTTVKSEEGSYLFQFTGYKESQSSAVFKAISNLPVLEQGMVLKAEYPSSGKPDLSAQEGTLELLSKYHYMTAEYIADGENPVWEDVDLSFTTQLPIFKLTLKNESFKGKTINNIKIIVGNNVKVTSITNFTASEDEGQIIAYFVLEPQQINDNTVITLVCDNIAYSAEIHSSTMLQAGKLYRIDKTMDVADVVMIYEDNKALITVYDENAEDAVSEKLYEALSDGLTDIAVKGVLSDSIRGLIDNILTEDKNNIILSIDDRTVYYVCDEVGFFAWGEAAQNKRWNIDCTLVDDIQLTKDWEYCIGTPSTYYNGIFNGKGHVISGLSINHDAVALGYYNPLALISYFTGEIRNVVLKGGRCRNTIDNNTSNSALLVGFNAGIIEGIILGKDVDGEYITFDINPSTPLHSLTLGAIVCTNHGVVKDCINKLPISISIPESTILYAGGIVGLNLNYLIQSVNKGDITVTEGTTKYVGGILGKSYSNKWYASKVFLCANITSPYNDINGGIVGYSWDSLCVIAGSYTRFGDVVGYKEFGGILDHCYMMDDNLINNMYSPYAEYIGSANLVYDEMNQSVAQYDCEYIDKKWNPGDGGCPHLIQK